MVFCFCTCMYHIVSLFLCIQRVCICVCACVYDSKVKGAFRIMYSNYSRCFKVHIYMYAFMQAKTHRVRDTETFQMFL